jgi:hypothetical protein
MTPGDFVGLIAAALFFGIFIGAWAGWTIGFLAGESSGRIAVANELTFHLAETQDD